MTSTNKRVNIDGQLQQNIAIVGIVVSDDVSSDGAQSPIGQL